MAKKIIKEKLNENKFLIMAHRGVSGGNIIENTDLAIKLGFLSGADIVELDVISSSDGEYYLFHKGMEEKLFGHKFDIEKVTSNEIGQLNYINETGKVTRKSPTKLSSALNTLKDGQLINLDRTWNYWEEFLPYLDKFSVQDKVILKSFADPKFLSLLDKHERKYMYFAIVTQISDIDLVKSYKGINLVGFEVIATSRDDDLFFGEEYWKLKDQDYCTLVNSEKLSDDMEIFADVDDERAVIDGEEVWDILLENKVDIIQTDYTWLMKAYRDRK